MTCITAEEVRQQKQEFHYPSYDPSYLHKEQEHKRRSRSIKKSPDKHSRDRHAKGHAAVTFEEDTPHDIPIQPGSKGWRKNTRLTCLVWKWSVELLLAKQ